MKDMLVWLGIGIVIGYFWGRFTTSKMYSLIFEQFRDEMHEQYLLLLKRHNITPKSDVSDVHKKVHTFPNNRNSKSA